MKQKTKPLFIFIAASCAVALSVFAALLIHDSGGPPRVFSQIIAPDSVEKSFGERLSDAAMERTKHVVKYDPAYVVIDYPNGDVPPDKGVCTDVVIRSYRVLGIDLQKLVHEDMRANFGKYPKKWGLTAPDKNIDHRRVPNLTTFFTRKGKKLSVTKNPGDYKTGDLVTWKITGGLDHIGVVVDKRSLGGKRPMIVHNIGAGPKCEDMLFRYEITGHYRYEP